MTRHKCEECDGTGLVGDEGPGKKNARLEWHPCDCPLGTVHRCGQAAGRAENKDGGPAFPFVEPPTECGTSPGMSLRDWFAGQALPAAIECTQRGFIMIGGPEGASRVAYEYADAMLKARKEIP